MKKEAIEKVSSCFDNNLLTVGSMPFVTKDKLNDYLSQNVTAKNENTTKEEVLEKIAKGLHINLRYGDESRELSKLMALRNLHKT